MRLSAFALALALAACASGSRFANCPSGSRYGNECSAPAAAAASADASALGPVTTASPMAAMPPAATPVRDVDEAMSASGGIGLKETAPLRYVVKKGDTLWGIANRYLADAYQWPELWYVNGKIANPHKIYPGDVLQLMVVNGRTQLVRGDDLERLSPRIRESELEDALPAIPIDAIRNFLRGPRVVDADTLNKAPYILSFVDEHIIGAMNNPVFIKNLKRDDGAAFSVVHKGVVYKDPDTGEILGYEAIPSGEAEIRAFGTPSDAMLTKSFREILLGDRLLPLEAENFQAFFYPHAPKAAVGAKIISVFNGVSQISQFQIVTLNRGSSQGLEAGHVLTILQAPRKIVDPVTGRADTLPEQEAGLLMVFKVMPKVSYGLVMSATRPVHVLDHAEKPDLKHSH